MRRNPCSSTLVARFLCSAAVLMLPSVAIANPVGGKVAAGAATISQPNAANTTVTQQSEKAIINWQSFSIGQGETTSFQQPDASAITLNRVTGVDPSSIMGSLTANGQVWLINPNGIAFGKTARVDVAGLLATTIDIKDQDFMSGNYQFSDLTDGSAMVTNAGHITIRDAGLGALVAPGVENSGVIEADLGQVQLSSADAFTVDFYGDGLFNITLDKQVTQAIKRQDGTTPSAAVTNSGTLIANGGKILLTANAASSVVNNAINMTGYAQATSASQSQNGTITLDGGSQGTVQVAGTLDASGKNTGETGGTVQVTGHDVQLASTAKVDVSGDAGGGTALIGGDEHGGGTLAHASTTSVASGATISADGVTKGNGGKVVVWSDDQTDYQGSISAKGGVTGGDGGSAEVSSHGVLAYGGTSDLSAPFGNPGTLLLDPRDVTIGTTGVWIITPQALVQALSANNVLVTTSGTGTDSGDITVASSFSWNGNNSLTLSANRNIIFDGGVLIENTGAASLTLRADNEGMGVGTVTFSDPGEVDWSASSGDVSIFYNPDDNPTGSGINPTSYTKPTDYSSYVLTNSAAQLASYMLVNSVYDLQNIDNNLSGDYALGRDIDASATAGWNAGTGFSPIGNSLDHEYSPDLFTGTLDGEGHVIDELTENFFNSSYAGLFWEIGPDGVVRNIGLTNVNLRAGTGALAAGAVAAINEGTIEDAYASGQISAASFCYGASCFDAVAGGLVGTNVGVISRSSAHVSVSISNGAAGGLVGGNEDATISQSFATGNVTGTSQDVGIGGLVGANEGPTALIENSYATGSVTGTASAPGSVSEAVGGLVAVNESGSILDSYSTGRVSGTISTSGTILAYYVGGLLGVNAYTFLFPPGLVGSSYWDTQTSGQVSSFGGLGQTTAQLQGALPPGFDSAIWVASSNTYPDLRWHAISTSVSVATLQPQPGNSLQSLVAQTSNAVTLPATTIPAYAVPNSSFSTTGSLVESTVAYVSINGTRVPVYLQEEDLSGDDAAQYYYANCIATVYAMAASIEVTANSGGQQITFVADNYTVSDGSGATRDPSKAAVPASGAPTISLAGVISVVQPNSINQATAPYGLPNSALSPMGSYSNSTGLAVVAGTFPGVHHPDVPILHVMLAIGTTNIDGATYIEVLDPATGAELALNSQGKVAGEILVGSDGSQTLVTDSGTLNELQDWAQVSEFQASGFAVVSTSS